MDGGITQPNSDDNPEALHIRTPERVYRDISADRIILSSLELSHVYFDWGTLTDPEPAKSRGPSLSLP